MLLDTVLFYVLAAQILGSAIMMITRRNVVYSAIWLISTLIGVAGIYLLQGAEFLAGVQIIVYVGRIVALFLFVLMLVPRDDEVALQHFANQKWLALLIVVVALFSLAHLVFYGVGALQHPGRIAPPEMGTLTENSETVGQVLFSQYLLPFELASVLLLVALIGAVVMAKPRKQKTPEQVAEQS